MPTATHAASGVALRDGSTVRVRPVAATDVAQLRALLASLSSQSLWLRFYTTDVNLDLRARAAATRGFGVVATAGTPERIVGHAGFVETGPGTAEIAFEVATEWQGLGVGTILLAHLAGLAPAAGIHTFTAVVHPTNHRMAHLLQASGIPLEVTAWPGQLLFELRPESGPFERVGKYGSGRRPAPDRVRPAAA